MARVALRFPRRAKWLLYAVALTSMVSGIGWYVLNRWFQVVDEFDIVQKHPWQTTLLKVHGASAFLVLIGFGYLLASHIHVGWRSRRNRVFGILLVADVTVQILSGYGLYYAGVDWRENIASLHFYSGLALPVLLIAHVLLGHRQRRVQDARRLGAASPVNS